MSCPDWKVLAAWRDDPRAEEPAEWQEALAHLDRGCVPCRRAACAADPTLVFRRLAVVPAQAPAQEATEADAMRRAVAAMRAASRVQAAERSSRSTWMAKWKHRGVAAALTVAALSMPTSPADHAVRPQRQPIAAALPAAMTAGSFEAGAALPGEDLPTLEGVDQPGARVYHMAGDGLAVTMIFDESLDALDV
jgi:hypothetical protein